MNKIDGRHERHMMRQRGAGARSIPTNFGFVFQAGPIQLSAATPAESPLPPNAPLPTAVYSEEQQSPGLPRPSEKAVPKRKRVIREEEDEDQVWFSKRSKKTTTKQQDDRHIASTAPEEVTLEETHTQPQPSIETKATKQKTVRKRVLVPKSRRKAPVEPESQPQHDQPTMPPVPAAEDVSKPKTKTKPVTARKQNSKQAASLAAHLQDHEPEDELSSHSLHDIYSSKPASSKKTRPNKDDHQQVADLKKHPKAVARKRVVRMDTQERVGNEQPSLKEDTKTTKSSPPLEKDEVEERSKPKVTRERKVAKEHVENHIEEEIIPEVQAVVTNSMEDVPPTLSRVEVPAEKKRKVVKRVRVPRVPKTVVVPETASAATQDEPKPPRLRRRLPLEEGTSNPSPKKPETNLNAKSLPEEKSNTRGRKTKQLNANKTESTEEAVSEDVSSQPTQMKLLRRSKSAVSEVEGADLALFEAEAPVLVTRKATKAPKRVFNDDSETDLDQMLSGIAAMAGTGAAKPSVTKSTRVAKRNPAVS